METPVICAVMEKDLNTTQKQALPITSSSMLVNDKNERRVNRVFYQEKMDYNQAVNEPASFSSQKMAQFEDKVPKDQIESLTPMATFVLISYF